MAQLHGLDIGYKVYSLTAVQAGNGGVDDDDDDDDDDGKFMKHVASKGYAAFISLLEKRLTWVRRGS